MRELYKTNLERIMARALDDAKIKAVYNYPIRCRFGYILDFAIPELKIDIECDGEVWHKLGNNKDRKRNWVLRKQGWEVIRFRGKEIKKDTQSCIARIKKLIERRLKENEDKS